jgi:hypothetical protein
MHTPNTRAEPRLSRRKTRAHRALPLTAVFASLAAVVAGCGGGSAAPRVAHLGTSAASTNANKAAVSGSRSAEAYAKCMRSHGVPTFPDPNSTGQVDASNVANLNSPQYLKAQEICRSLAPSGPDHSIQGGSLTPQQLAQLLKFAGCMRSHGVPKFPDPTSRGLSPAGVDPNSRQFQAAQKACRSVLPNRGKGKVQSAGGGVKP